MAIDNMKLIEMETALSRLCREVYSLREVVSDSIKQFVITLIFFLKLFLINKVYFYSRSA